MYCLLIKIMFGLLFSNSLYIGVRDVDKRRAEALRKAKEEADAQDVRNLKEYDITKSPSVQKFVKTLGSKKTQLEYTKAMTKQWREEPQYAGISKTYTTPKVTFVDPDDPTKLITPTSDRERYYSMLRSSSSNKIATTGEWAGRAIVSKVTHKDDRPPITTTTRQQFLSHIYEEQGKSYEPERQYMTLTDPKKGTKKYFVGEREFASVPSTSTVYGTKIKKKPKLLLKTGTGETFMGSKQPKDTTQPSPDIRTDLSGMSDKQVELYVEKNIGDIIKSHIMEVPVVDQGTMSNQTYFNITSKPKKEVYTPREVKFGETVGNITASSNMASMSNQLFDVREIKTIDKVKPFKVNWEEPVDYPTGVFKWQYGETELGRKYLMASSRAKQKMELIKPKISTTKQKVTLKPISQYGLMTAADSKALGYDVTVEHILKRKGLTQTFSALKDVTTPSALKYQSLAAQRYAMETVAEVIEKPEKIAGYAVVGAGYAGGGRFILGTSKYLSTGQKAVGYGAKAAPYVLGGGYVGSKAIEYKLTPPRQRDFIKMAAETSVELGGFGIGVKGVTKLSELPFKKTYFGTEKGKIVGMGRDQPYVRREGWFRGRYLKETTFDFLDTKTTRSIISSPTDTTILTRTPKGTNIKRLFGDVTLSKQFIPGYDRGTYDYKTPLVSRMLSEEKLDPDGLSIFMKKQYEYMGLGRITSKRKGLTRQELFDQIGVVKRTKQKIVASPKTIQQRRLDIELISKKKGRGKIEELYLERLAPEFVEAEVKPVPDIYEIKPTLRGSRASKTSESKFIEEEISYLELRGESYITEELVPLGKKGTGQFSRSKTELLSSPSKIQKSRVGGTISRFNTSLAPQIPILKPQYRGALGYIYKPNTKQATRFDSKISYGSVFDTRISTDLGTELGTRLDTKLGTELGTNINTRLGTELGTKFGTKFDTKLSTKMSTKLDTQLSSRLTTRLTTKLSTLTPGRTTRTLNLFTPPPPTPPKTPPPNLTLPPLDFGVGYGKKRKKKGLVGRYKPSVYGIDIFKATGKGITQPLKMVGLGIRPVVKWR